MAENAPSGSVTLTVTATRRGDPNEVITVLYSTSDGTATANSDYTPVSGTVTFGAGEVQKTITVPITNDTSLEDAETFSVVLSNPAMAALGTPSSATVTISDDDSQASSIRFESATYTVSESGSAVTLAVTRSGGLGLVASANYATSDGTATAGSDYTATQGTVTFPAGSVRQTITVPIVDDNVLESTETFSVALSSPSINASIGNPATATVTIIENDNGSTVQFSPKTYTVNEAAGQITLTVVATRFGDPNTQITVDYASRDGSATQTQDYGAVAGRLVFNAGQTQQQIVVPITNDLLLENAENFFVDLTNPSNASLVGDGSSIATVNIADDDSGTSTIQFSTAAASLAEGDGSITLTVVRSGGIGLAVSVNYASANGTATAGSDYTAVAGTLSFASGETQKTIVVLVTSDSFAEGNETFSVALSNPSAGAALGSPSSETITINDDDGTGSTVQFNPTSYTANETPGNSTVTLSITATRLGDPNTPITVNYATSNGSATAGSDYIAKSDSVTFGPAETQKSITLTILDDGLVENAESFFVTLTFASGASVSGSPATVTIADDDSPTATIGFSASSYDVNENAGAVTLNITRSGGRQFSATVNYQTMDGTAKAGVNYVASNGTVTFAPGETSKTIQVPLIDDAEPSPTLQFTVKLTDANGTGFVGAQNTATVNIRDNDVNVIRFEKDNYSVDEGAGSVSLKVIAIRVGDTTEELTVDYVTTDGSAKEGVKYARTAGRLTFGANVTSQTITVPIFDNAIMDGTTNFNVLLSNPRPTDTTGGRTASTLGSPSTAIVSIIDNDARRFQFSSSTYTVPNSNGVANLVVTLSRAGDNTGTYTVDFNTSDDSAIAGRDYTASSGTLVFGPGETSKSISINLTPQSDPQPTRQFFVRLSNPSSGTEIAQSSATVVIRNPDLTTKLLNISTRGPVEFGNQVMIAGFILQGTAPTTVVLRGLGPSLTQTGVVNAIDDPNLTLFDGNGNQFAFNDNFGTNSQVNQARLADLTPTDARESAIVATLSPGAYTAILRGNKNGIGLVEVYDIDREQPAHFDNISTRGKVEMGDNGAMIGGFIIVPPDGRPGTGQRLLIRALGPSLTAAGLNGALADPTLELYRGSQKILENDNWKTQTGDGVGSKSDIEATGLKPANDKEAVLLVTLDPGAYTAVIRGKGNTTGIGLVEVYRVGP